MRPQPLSQRLLGGLLVLLLAPAAVTAEEQLTLPTPDGWRTLTNLATPLLRRSEFAIPAPGGTDKLSFEWFAHSLAPGLDPLDLSAQLAAGVRRECNGSRDNPVFAGYENGYPTVVRLITCPQRRGTEEDGAIGEVLMLKAIQGETGHWLMVRGRRLASFGADGTSLSPDTVRAWTEDFLAITLCDPERSDAHPCPTAPLDADATVPD